MRLMLLIFNLYCQKNKSLDQILFDIDEILTKKAQNFIEQNPIRNNFNVYVFDKKTVDHLFTSDFLRLVLYKKMLIHEEKKILCINFNTNKVSDKKIYLNVLYNKCLNFLTEDDNRCVDDFNFKDLIVSVKHHKFKCSISLENFISLNIVEKIDMYSFLFLYSNKISKFELYVFLSDIIEKESIEKKINFIRYYRKRIYKKK